MVRVSIDLDSGEMGAGVVLNSGAMVVELGSIVVRLGSMKDRLRKGGVRNWVAICEVDWFGEVEATRSEGREGPSRGGEEGRGTKDR